MYRTEGSQTEWFVFATFLFSSAEQRKKIRTVALPGWMQAICGSLDTGSRREITETLGVYGLELRAEENLHQMGTRMGGELTNADRVASLRRQLKILIQTDSRNHKMIRSILDEIDAIENFETKKES